MNKNEYISFNVTFNPCIVCGKMSIEMPALSGSKILSDYSELEGPICSKCVPTAVSDPHYTLSSETEEWYLRYLKEKLGDIISCNDSV